MVWPQIAEISLLGALGCGRWLIELLLDELEAEGSPYLYVVTQACPQYLACPRYLACPQYLLGPTPPPATHRPLATA